MTGGLEQVLAEIEDDRGLVKPDGMRKRLEALDRLDAYFPEIENAEHGDEADTAELGRRSRDLRDRLEKRNRELYAAIRYEIQRGDPGGLMKWVDALAESEGGREPAKSLRYDNADELISGVFQFAEPEVGKMAKGTEMVFYQPTPARHIFDLIHRTALTDADVLVDLGSGLGHVPLLVSICTRARTHGIELEGRYVERARECARTLNVHTATFEQQDAREADLSTGTVFYLHTPFKGSILRSVLNRLKGEAARRPIRICSYGPCTATLSEEPWLEAELVPDVKRIALFNVRP